MHVVQKSICTEMSLVDSDYLSSTYVQEDASCDLDSGSNRGNGEENARQGNEIMGG
jgi:hypothetical protein